MKKLPVIIATLSAVWLLISCKTVYIPNNFNSPLLRNKGDAQLTFSSGFSGIELQGAYALTDHWGIIANGQYCKNPDKENESYVYKLAEGGIGYTEHFSDRGVFEFFAGSGIGEAPADFRHFTYTGTEKARVKRLFLQPAIGFSNDLIDISLVTRLAGVNMGGETNWFFEPGVVGKIGYRRFRLVGTFGFSTPLRSYDQRSWDQLPFFINLGLHINLGKRKKIAQE